MAKPLHTRAVAQGWPHEPSIRKALLLREALAQRVPLHEVIADLRGLDDVDLGSLASIGLGGVLMCEGSDYVTLPILHSLSDDAVVGEGDVLRIHPSGQINVLYRRGANANALFVTERCNSKCLMCSQPPRDDNDDWRIAELARVIPLLDPELPVLGVTGGEPTLLGSKLGLLFETAKRFLPHTTLHVLSNGRAFQSRVFTAGFQAAVDQVVWAVPLYAPTAAAHDYIVQSSGAFVETVHGLYNLAEAGHAIELRCVISRENAGRLLALAEFVSRNLPFVRHVAFMGLEPMGYARVNRAALWIDPADYGNALRRAVLHLHLRDIPVSIYNLPLCVLQEDMRPFARQSISDWKNVYAPECDGCAVKDQCSGFFRSAGADWRSRDVAAVRAPEAVA
ncbi:MAG: His-Xaa-Ser system radical SAM maturase HxsC [Xanthobacteraceae bacterium]|nr:His-Xaa-Ser system radical SAM maturase HxsC [Xanthobacteraceae bacterium]